MAGANFSGLNVATKAGEGAAHINHWENFYGTINQIQQRELANQKLITDAVTKSQLEMADIAKGIRPKEIPPFTKKVDEFTNASLMTASGDVKKDPQKLREWTKKKNDAYISAMTIADGSKQAAKFKSGLIDNVFKSKGIGYKSPEELSKIYEQYDNMSLEEIAKGGYNTPNPYLLPPDTFSKEDYDKHIFGELKTKPDLQEVKDPGGRVIGRNKNEIQYYSNDIPTIASKTAQVIAGVHDVSQSAKAEYEKDLATSPDQVKNTFDEAHKIVDNIPGTQVKPQLPNDYVGYAVAKNILRAQPKNVGTSAYTEDPDYKRSKDEAFKLKMQDRSLANRKNMIILSHSLKAKDEQPPAVNSELLYDAARYPNKNFEMKGKDGKSVYLNGREVLDAGLQAIAGDNPKNTDAVQLDRFTMVSQEGRRRIVEKLLPSLAQSEREELITGLSGKGESNSNATIKAVLDKINETYGQNLKIDDINRYAIPVFINKSYTTDIDKKPVLIVKPVIVNPGTNNFGQFHSTLSNQVTSKKKSGMKAENPNFIGALQELSQDDDQ